MMIRIVAWLSIGLLAGGCTGVQPDPAEIGEAEVLTTDRTSYRAGEVARMALRNATPHALGFNLCTSTLQRRHEEDWVTAEYEEERVCTLELRLLEPGDTAFYDFTLDPRLSAGEYRFRANVEDQVTQQRVAVISNSFAVTR